MLSVSSQQMESLYERLGPAILRGRLMAHFKKYDPAWIRSMPPEEIDRRLTVGIERARRWQIETFEGVGIFICAMQSAPRFDQHPPFRAALSDPAADEAAKIAAICRAEMLREWRSAADLGQEWEI